MESKEQFKVTSRDRKRYVLGERKDFAILEKIYRLEKKRLSAVDKQTVKLIKAQLRRDWRVPLLRELNHLLKKYN